MTGVRVQLSLDMVLPDSENLEKKTRDQVQAIDMGFG